MYWHVPEVRRGHLRQVRQEPIQTGDTSMLPHIKQNAAGQPGGS